MTTLEAIIEELQHVPPERLNELRELVRSFMEPNEANKKLAAETMRVLEGMDKLSAEDWEDIDRHMREVRANLFTRSLPEFDDETDAA